MELRTPDVHEVRRRVYQSCYELQHAKQVVDDACRAGSYWALGCALRVEQIAQQALAENERALERERDYAILTEHLRKHGTEIARKLSLVQALEEEHASLEEKWDSARADLANQRRLAKRPGRPGKDAADLIGGFEAEVEIHHRNLHEKERELTCARELWYRLMYPCHHRHLKVSA